jgi:hypothetical protein
MKHTIAIDRKNVKIDEIDFEHLSEFRPIFNVAPQTFQPVTRLKPGTGEAKSSYTW